jgi:hypothetical protein
MFDGDRVHLVQERCELFVDSAFAFKIAGFKVYDFHFLKVLVNDGNDGDMYVVKDGWFGDRRRVL